MKKLQDTMPMEARLFVLIPTQSHNAIIICRRSSKKVGLFHWDMLTNKIRVSQWMKGRIYEYFADISPNGKHFIYSMNQKGCGYTVISKAPWIKAISMWENVGGWGGGIFINDKQYMLYDGHMGHKKFLDKSLEYIEKEKFSTKYLEFLNGLLYSQRLIDRGWSRVSKGDNIEVFQKNIEKNIFLEKTLYGYPHGSNVKGKGQFWETHKLIINDEIEEKKDWEWCEYRYNNIYYAQKGCLYERSSVNGESKLIYDFNEEEFVKRIAPY